MKKFIIYLLVIVLAVSLGFAVFYLVRDNEVISISSASIYKDAGEPFQIDVNHQNKKSYTTITVSTSNASVVSYNKDTNTFKAEKGGVARINFRTTNAKFRNLWCDVIVGDGTVESPYYISTPEQLASIGMGVYDETTGTYKGSTKYNQKYEKYSSDKCYKLVSDIDLKDINEGYWIPLREFSGRLDGNGFTIRNMNIDRDKYIETFEEDKDYDPNIFVQDYVGMFQKIAPSGLVYNFKLANVYASSKYTNFGVITAENKGSIERVEVEDAYLSVETENAFGGLVAYNITTEEGENDTYTRNIARIDRCSIIMTLGKKIVVVDDEAQEVISGMNGVVGGLVGVNQGGAIVYSYVRGEVAFGSDQTNPIIYGGIVGENTYIKLTKTGGSYISQYQGGSIKDCYSDLITNFDCQPVNENSIFAGAIARNIDKSTSLYEESAQKEIVNNYLVGVYYNKDNLNATQEGISKDFKGVGYFEYNDTTFVFEDEKKTVYGLSEEEMKVGNNFLSHATDEITFDENGVSQGIEESEITWLFGSVWAIDNEHNDGKPYLNYQLIYIPDDFVTAGTPIIKDKNKYTFEKAEVETAPIITSGTNGVISLQVGQTYAIKVTPAGLKYTWQSSDSSIASVDANGVVTANNEGRVSIIVANKSGITDSITVIVTKVAVTISGLPTSEITLKEGDTYTLRPTISPATSATYSSSDNSVATVASSTDTKSCTITGVQAGTCNVYIKAGDTVARVVVKVYEDTSTKIATISLSDGSTAIAEDATISKTYRGSVISGKINATVSYNSNNITSQVTLAFRSSNSNIMSIDDNGNYNIKGSGMVSIIVTASSSNYVATTGFNVIIGAENIIPSEPIENLSFNLSNYSLYVGQSFTIVASGTTKTIHYSIGDSSIAKVSTSGTVTALKAGTTTLTGYIVRSDGSYSYAYCTVVVMQKAQKTISISPKSTSAKVGETVDFYATVENGESGYSITWSCYPSTYATLSKVDNSHYRVTIKSAGTISVTAKSGDVSATASIVATDPNAYSEYIYNANQLNAVRNHLDKHFVIAANIDLSGWDWVPIGTKSSPFRGSIENNGAYTIYNMNVDNNYEYAGLFGYASSANIKGIRISDSNVQGQYVGAVLGYGSGVKISNCVVSSCSLYGSVATGGIVGRAISNSVISNCTVNGNMNISTISGSTSGTKYVGGIVGQAYRSSTISSCYVSMSGRSITLGSSTYGYAGGIAGQTDSAITNVSVQANITANSSDNDYAGGIVGYTSANITNGVVKNTSVKGYYAGGIGGTLSHSNKISIYFSTYEKGYKKSDISSSSYSTNVSKIAVKEGVTITGCDAGGLFGVIKNGVVKDCYTRAKLCGLNSSAIKGGFASIIEASGITNAGGSGYAGIVENCYSACTFDSKGKKNYSITSSLVHNYNGTKSSNAVGHGFCFNYVFDNDLDGNATYVDDGQIFSKSSVDAKKSSSEMKTASTYTKKDFSTAVWNLNSGYPTLYIESSL